jgi:hypothetical protein
MVALREAAFRIPVGYRFILGTLLITVVLVAPGGLAAVASLAWARLRSRRPPIDAVPVGGGERPWTHPR